MTRCRDLSALPSTAAVVLQNNGLLVTWEITTGGGHVITLGELDLLDSVEAVQLTATPNNDTIDISAWTAGAISIDGGAGLDILQATVNGLVTLTDTAVTLGGGTGSIAFSGIEAAILIGSDGDDLLNAAAFSGVVWLQGRAGNDILVASRGTLILASSILDGQDGDDLFLFAEDGALNRILIRGGEGEDTLSFGRDAALGILPFTAGVTCPVGQLHQ